MITKERARTAILWVDGLGLAAYLYWLSRQGGRIFHHSDGIFYLLPCLPLIFVLVFLLHPTRPAEPGDD